MQKKKIMIGLFFKDHRVNKKKKKQRITEYNTQTACMYLFQQKGGYICAIEAVISIIFFFFFWVHLFVHFFGILHINCFGREHNGSCQLCVNMSGACFDRLVSTL